MEKADDVKVDDDDDAVDDDGYDGSNRLDRAIRRRRTIAIVAVVDAATFLPLVVSAATCDVSSAFAFPSISLVAPARFSAKA